MNVYKKELFTRHKSSAFEATYVVRVCRQKRHLRKRPTNETNLHKCEGLQKGLICKTQIKCIWSDICSECIHNKKRSTKERSKRDLLTQVWRSTKKSYWRDTHQVHSKRHMKLVFSWKKITYERDRQKRPVCTYVKVYKKHLFTRHTSIAFEATYEVRVSMEKRNLRKRQTKETYLHKCECLQKRVIYETQIKCICSKIWSESMIRKKNSIYTHNKRDLQTRRSDTRTKTFVVTRTETSVVNKDQCTTHKSSGIFGPTYVGSVYMAKRALQKRPTNEIYQWDQVTHTYQEHSERQMEWVYTWHRETYKRDLQKIDTYKRDVLTGHISGAFRATNGVSVYMAKRDPFTQQQKRWQKNLCKHTAEETYVRHAYQAHLEQTYVLSVYLKKSDLFSRGKNTYLRHVYQVHSEQHM